MPNATKTGSEGSNGKRLILALRVGSSMWSDTSSSLSQRNISAIEAGVILLWAKVKSFA